MRQTPHQGTRSVRHRGDLLRITLEFDPSWKGSAWLRTNLGRAAVGRREIILQAERREPALARDWHDLPMRPTDAGACELNVPLTETGCFEFKAFFVRQDTGAIVWAEGSNAFVKVEPAATVAANTIYSAFVRQFGPDRGAGHQAGAIEKSVSSLESAGYTVIPRSGTFRDLAMDLDLIICRMGFRIIQLLPIHPTPTTYARMGRFGSPFASLDFMDVDPSLAEFDRRTTPLDQFRELADAIHARGARLFIDLPINHTGWASWLQIHHPEWFARNNDRSFQSPGAWGVTWEDLSRLDYGHRDLWIYMADVFLHWCRQGVDGFRCDAGYMVPVEVWTYITARVRDEFPETVFFLEGLGGKLEVMETLLWRGGMNWAYSELFQNYDRAQIEGCLSFCNRVSTDRGLLVHFAETHDNNRLAATSAAYSSMRTALSALCSVEGGFGITAGVEWFAEDKIDVHGAPPLSWGREPNQVAAISRLNGILDSHPCFGPGIAAEPVTRGHGNVVAFHRESAAPAASVVVAANLDCANRQTVRWPSGLPRGAGRLTDLLSGETVDVRDDGADRRIELEPGRVVCLSAAAADAAPPAGGGTNGIRRWERCNRQEAAAAALTALQACAPDAAPASVDVDSFLADPAAFCGAASNGGYTPLVAWNPPEDLRREAPVPPGHLVLARNRAMFHLTVTGNGRTLYSAASLECAGGGHFVLVPPLPPGAAGAARREITITTWRGNAAERETSSLLYLSEPGRAAVRYKYRRDEAMSPDLHAVLTNGRGAMSQVRAHWGVLNSIYDAFLAANLDPDCPVDRHIMLTRCRAWLVRREYSQEVNAECLVSFSREPGGEAAWEFAVPAGMGMNVRLLIRLRLHHGRNAVSLTVSRPPSVAGNRDSLPDAEPVSVIIRPDIEDRLNHHTTKAYMGAERAWPRAVAAEGAAFVFSPARDRALRMRSRAGSFTVEPAWQYMVQRPFEATRGLDSASDLFSPGYFRFDLGGGDSCVLDAWIGDGDPPPFEAHGEWKAPPPAPLKAAMASAIREFTVSRDSHRTVIAGYPWFLDWGRDTLIALRGIIAAGMLGDARDILRQFAAFEWKGTLPNMIRGRDDTNRDTSDAPLWFGVACSDMAASEGGGGILADGCGGRTILQVVESIAANYLKGTPNGMIADAESGLVYSPAHFTWMDTNYPAGTPREGYPIEIQALWYSTLALLARHKPADPSWAALAERVRSSIVRLYWDSGRGYLADSLSAPRGVPASRAAPDDALRPNQLLALTLGAVADRQIAAHALSACSALVVPGAIRSLADRPVKAQLPVWHRGVLLNDPARPYWGRYEGDEDTRRKPAYHNGTAWTWLFPSYAEAMLMTWGKPAARPALAVLESSCSIAGSGAVGHIPEILDGNLPHTQRGCPAQAWGASELYRVLDKIEREV